jgi:hypothetical protein
MFGSNPMFQRALQMAQGKSEDQIKQIAKNLCQQRGFNIDEMFSRFQSQMSAMFGQK